MFVNPMISHVFFINLITLYVLLQISVAALLPVPVLQLLSQIILGPAARQPLGIVPDFLPLPTASSRQLPATTESRREGPTPLRLIKGTFATGIANEERFNYQPTLRAPAAELNSY